MGGGGLLGGLGHVFDIFDEHQDVADISFSKLFPSTAKVYKNSFINACIQSKTSGINPVEQLIYKKINFLNAKQFERLGLASKVKGIVYGLNNSVLEAYLEQNGICDSPTINNITQESIYLLKLKDFLENNNNLLCYSKDIKEPTSNGDYQTTMYPVFINDDVYIPNTDENGYIINSGYSYEMIKLNKTNTETFNGDGSTTEYTLVGSDKIFNILSVTVDNVESEYSVENLCQENTKIVFSEPPVEGSNISIAYEYLDINSTETESIELTNTRNTFSASYGCDGITKYLYEFIDVVADKIDEQDFLFIPVKHGGSIIGATNAQKVVMREIGIDYESFIGSVSDSKIKESFISLSTNRTDPLFNDIFDLIYGTSGNKRTLILENRGIEIKYYWNDDKNKVSINGYSENAGSNGYLIPINSFLHLPIKEYFEQYQKSACVITYASDTVEVAWYNSTFFQFVTIAIGMTIGNPAIVAGLFIATQLVLDMDISSDLKTAIIVGMGIAVSIYYNNGNFKLTFQNVSKIVTELGKYYFKSKIRSINEEINDITENEKNIEKIINKFKEQTIYFPMDATQSYYDLQYDLLYSFYDLHYNTVNETEINDKTLI